MDLDATKSLILCCRLSINNSHSGRASTLQEEAQAHENNVETADLQVFFRPLFRPTGQLVMDIIQIVGSKMLVILSDGINRISHKLSYFFDCHTASNGARCPSMAENMRM